MIIQEISESDFIKAFEDYNRSDDFTIEGRIALFNYINECYTDENPFNLDIIAICCDFNEYKDIEEYLNNYDTDLKKEDYEDEDDFKQAVEDEISDNTTLIKLSDDLDEGFIIQAY